MSSIQNRKGVRTVYKVEAVSVNLSALKRHSFAEEDFIDPIVVYCKSRRLAVAAVNKTLALIFDQFSLLGGEIQTDYVNNTEVHRSFKIKNNYIKQVRSVNEKGVTHNLIIRITIVEMFETADAVENYFKEAARIKGNDSVNNTQ